MSCIIRSGSLYDPVRIGERIGTIIRLDSVGRSVRSFENRGYHDSTYARSISAMRLYRLRKCQWGAK